MGQMLPYRSWPEPMKATLDLCFADLQAGRPYQHPCLDRAANNARGGKPNPPGGGSNIFAPAAQAFNLYAGQMAHVLYLEANQLVPWSLADMDEVELVELLSSNRYFRRIVPSAHLQAVTYYPSHIQPGRDYQLTDDTDGLVCDPRVGYRFLHGLTSTSGRNLVGSTARATMVNLTRWCAETVAHGDFNTTGVNINDWFQLEDRLRRRDNPLGGPPVITRAGWGCHTTAHLLHDLARCINLPLIKIRTTFEGQLHAGLVFFDGWERDPGAVTRAPTRGTGGILGAVLDRVRRLISGPLVQTLLGAFGISLPALRRRALVLEQSDDINAFGMAPCFPIRSNGTPMGEAEKWTLFFDQVWVTRDELERWGYRNSPHYDLHTVSDPLDDLPDKGVDGGNWVDFHHSRAFIVEHQMKVGAWVEFLSLCPQTSDVVSLYDQSRTEASSPLATYLSQFEACIAAAGGCDSLRQAALLQWASRETSVLADPP